MPPNHRGGPLRGTLRMEEKTSFPQFKKKKNLKRGGVKTNCFLPQSRNEHAFWETKKNFEADHGEPPKKPEKQIHQPYQDLGN